MSTELNHTEKAEYARCGHSAIQSADLLTAEIRRFESPDKEAAANGLHQVGHANWQKQSMLQAIPDLHRELLDTIATRVNEGSLSAASQGCLAAYNFRQSALASLPTSSRHLTVDNANQLWEIAAQNPDERYRATVLANALLVLKRADLVLEDKSFAQFNHLAKTVCTTNRTLLFTDRPNEMRFWLAGLHPHTYSGSLRSLYCKMLECGSDREVDVALRAVHSFTTLLDQPKLRGQLLPVAPAILESLVSLATDTAKNQSGLRDLEKTSQFVQNGQPISLRNLGQALAQRIQEKLS